MVAWRYEIPLVMLKNMFNKFLTLAQSYNIFYIIFLFVSHFSDEIFIAPSGVQKERVKVSCSLSTIIVEC